MRVSVTNTELSRNRRDIADRKLHRDLNLDERADGWNFSWNSTHAVILDVPVILSDKIDGSDGEDDEEAT